MLLWGPFSMERCVKLSAVPSAVKCINRMKPFQEVIDALLNKANPALLAVVGYAAIILLTWLMKFKPF